MIAFSGYFGGGKTYSMVSALFRAKKKGSIVITNFTTDFSDLILRDQNQFIDFLYQILLKSEERERQGVFQPFPQKIYIGLDEGGILFNSRNFKDFPKELPDFMFQLRKLNVEIFYTVQYPQLIDVNFRRITEYWHNLRKIHPKASFAVMDTWRLNPENPDFSSLLTGNKKLSFFPAFVFFSEKIGAKYNTFELVKKHSARTARAPNPLYDSVFDLSKISQKSILNENQKKITQVKKMDNPPKKIHSFFTDFFSKKIT